MRSPTPRTRRCLSAFTLLEVLIALAVLAVLTAIAVPQFLGYRERVVAKQAMADVRMLENRIDSYRDEFGGFPSTLAEVTDPVPRDPWGNSYAYLKLQGAGPSAAGMARKDKNLVPLNTDYDLYSKGPDGDTKVPLTAKASHDDIVRANDGAYVGRAEDY